MRSPIRWLGGKSKLIKRLLPWFPRHSLYCEPFGGGASVLLAKKRAGREIYNDLDKRLYSLFFVLQDPNLFDQFYCRIQLIPYSREERKAAYLIEKALPDNTVVDYENIVDAATRAFILTRQSFGGLIDKTAWGFVTTTITSGMAQATAQWISTIKRLPEVHERLRTVLVTSEPWQSCVAETELLEGPTLIYLDPPYLPETRRDGYYRHEMTREDHEELVKTVLQSPSMMVLSGYPNDVYRSLEDAGWIRIDFDVKCHVVAKTKATGLKGKGASGGQKRVECIWINPAAKEQLEKDHAR